LRRIRAILPLICTVVIVYLLDKPIGSLPALGRLLDPMNGCWANAEPVNKNFDLKLNLSSLQQPVAVWFDKQLVPHIRAANDHDLYFVQGYVHAYFRLWQMDMQTRAAAGRVSEVVGDKALTFDRTQRRKGMVFGAENSLKAMEAEPRTKTMLDAYTAGINQYISSLKYRNYPLEYKLMGFQPEPWTNLKSALLLKYMADDLTGYTEDIPMTILKDKRDANDSFLPEIRDYVPVVPRGTAFAPPSLKIPKAPNDTSIWAHLSIGTTEQKREDGKGSNNWALSGARTKSGAAILCNDPHLSLNLPSLWYQMQLQTPGINVCGVSLPGAPGIVIGFNDSISWGFTNNYRDVKDFYAVQLSDNNSTYLFDGKHVPMGRRIESIKIKGKPDYQDTVFYTLQGPVIYDEHFPGPGGLKQPIAMCWMAHKPTNELLSLYLLNRSGNYDEFVAAIMHFECPAQNMLYADRKGNIAIWGQGQFINKWKDQGKYVMNGAKSNTLWGENIPMNENPHAINPPQGYLFSANQTVTDSTYPYWYNGYFYQFRAWRINNVLSNLHMASVEDMFALQNDVYSVLAERILPVLMKYAKASKLSGKETKYIQMLESWDYKLTSESKAATIFQLWWEKICSNFSNNKLYKDVLSKSERVMSLILAAETYNENHHKYLSENIIQSLKQTTDSLDKFGYNIEWYHVKNTTIRHLARLPAFSYSNLKIGGWGNTVNAAKDNHGPSWRMVVQMGKEIEAYGVYPGGQSGNPGSKYYASFLEQWAVGKYNRLVFLSNNERQNNKAIKYKWTIQPK
jgi:penicillin amidase